MKIQAIPSGYYYKPSVQKQNSPANDKVNFGSRSEIIKYCKNFENIEKMFRTKLTTDLQWRPNQYVGIKFSKVVDRIKSIPDGHGIVGIEKQSNSPYYPTTFKYGPVFKDVEYKEPQLKLTLIDTEKRTELEDFCTKGKCTPYSCDFIWDNSRSSEQIAEDLYNTYKHLRYLRYYKAIDDLKKSAK